VLQFARALSTPQGTKKGGLCRLDEKRVRLDLEHHFSVNKVHDDAQNRAHCKGQQAGNQGYRERVPDPERLLKETYQKEDSKGKDPGKDGDDKEPKRHDTEFLFFVRQIYVSLKERHAFSPFLNENGRKQLL
jgi:hypothetical protein